MPKNIYVTNEHDEEFRAWIKVEYYSKSKTEVNKFQNSIAQISYPAFDTDQFELCPIDNYRDYYVGCFHFFAPLNEEVEFANIELLLKDGTRKEIPLTVKVKEIQLDDKIPVYRLQRYPALNDREGVLEPRIIRFDEYADLAQPKIGGIIEEYYQDEYMTASLLNDTLLIESATPWVSGISKGYLLMESDDGEQFYLRFEYGTEYVYSQMFLNNWDPIAKEFSLSKKAGNK